ncbi:MAG: molecular chaperone TorD family protein [bacterium]
MSASAEPLAEPAGSDPTLEALGRAALYRALAHALAYPTADRVARALASVRARLAAAPLAAPLHDALVAVAAAFERADREALAAEHVRLFGPAGGAPLHETAYGDAGRMLGRSAQLADISGFYLAYGLDPTTSEPLPEDHLLLELEFMSILGLKEAYARNEGFDDPLAITVDAQRKFLGEHLGTWLDGWLAALATAEAGALHLALATLVRDVVRDDCARLGVVPHVITHRAVDIDMGGDAVVCPHASPAEA